jgi:hypothetical protein
LPFNHNNACFLAVVLCTKGINVLMFPHNVFKNFIQMLVLVCAMKSFFYPTILCIRVLIKGVVIVMIKL